MIARTIKVTDGPKGLQPIGTEIHHKDAWRLVQMGLAVPADKECQEVIDALTTPSEAAIERREFIAQHRADIAAAQPAPPPEDRAKLAAALTPVVVPAEVNPAPADADSEAT